MVAGVINMLSSCAMGSNAWCYFTLESSFSRDENHPRQQNLHPWNSSHTAVSERLCEAPVATASVQVTCSRMAALYLQKWINT